MAQCDLALYLKHLPEGLLRSSACFVYNKEDIPGLAYPGIVFMFKNNAICDHNFELASEDPVCCCPLILAVVRFIKFRLILLNSFPLFEGFPCPYSVLLGVLPETKIRTLGVLPDSKISTLGVLPETLFLLCGSYISDLYILTIPLPLPVPLGSGPNHIHDQH